MNGMHVQYLVNAAQMLEVARRVRCGPLTIHQFRRGLHDTVPLAVQAGWVEEKDGLYSKKGGYEPPIPQELVQEIAVDDPQAGVWATMVYPVVGCNS